MGIGNGLIAIAKALREIRDELKTLNELIATQLLSNQ